MNIIDIPYDHTTLPLEIDDTHLKAVLTARMHDLSVTKSEEAIIEAALKQPIGSCALQELARDKRHIVIVTSDHTRAVPSHLTLPILLRHLRSASPEARITILIATGLHRSPTDTEMRHMFGDDIVDHEEIMVNDAFDPDQFITMGTLPSGAVCDVNKLAVTCDFLMTEGFIEPHFFAGFSGGRKSILPGICSERTVNANHSYQAVASPYAKTGILTHNPIHEDMVKAARMVNVQFILNVALNAQKKVIAAWAGDLEAAHAQGVAFIREWSECEKITGDIIITSNGGYPLDQNLYQSPKAVATAKACAGDDGLIIMVCGCADGMGGTHFRDLMQYGTIAEIDHYLSQIPPEKTISEQWSAQIYARILKKHQMILISMLPDEAVRKANMIPAHTLADALAMAYQIKGRDASVVVIPDGVSVLIRED